MYYTIYASSEENYMYYNYNQTITQPNHLMPKDKVEPICIICWGDIEPLPPVLLKQNKNYITFCDCNTYTHNECLKRWYCITYSCPICRTYIIYDPEFTNRVRTRQKINGYIGYFYNIANQITNIICVLVALNILCNIYLIFYPIDVIE